MNRKYGVVGSNDKIGIIYNPNVRLLFMNYYNYILYNVKEIFFYVEMINYYNINERHFKWFQFRAMDRKLIEDFV